MNNLQTFNILDLGLLAVYLLAAALLCRRFIGLKDFKLQMLPYLIVVIHLFSSIGFYFFVKDGVGDAKGYFLVASSMDFFGQGGYSSTGFIENMLYPFVRYLQFSFFSTFLIFSYISLLGFMMLYDIAVRQLKGVWSPWLYLFLLPSMHFWTGAVGKDALIFFAITWLLHNYLTKKVLLKYCIALIIIGLVRFYVLALVGVGVGIAIVIMSKQIKPVYKFFAGLLFIGMTVAVLPFFLESISVGEVSNISKRTKIIVTANQEGGGAVDLQNSNLLVKWFSYLFRPFLFEATSAQMLITAFENIFWLVIFWKIAQGIRFRKYITKSRQTIFWICVASLITVTLPSAFILSNFGISSRQKMMIAPMMMYLFFESLLAIRHKKKFIHQKIKRSPFNKSTIKPSENY